MVDGGLVSVVFFHFEYLCFDGDGLEEEERPVCKLESGARKKLVWETRSRDIYISTHWPIHIAETCWI